MSTKTTIGSNNNNPITRYYVEGNSKFLTGVDKTDDKFKISTGSNLESSAFEIDSSGNVIIKNNDKVNYGFIAQEVEKVLPEIVSTDKDGYKSVNYQNTIAILIEGMKEQQKQIDELKKKLGS